MITVSIELGISELTRKEMTSRIKHVGATHQSLLAKAWSSVASATPCISFDVAELLLKEIYEQHSANESAVENILGEHYEYFITKASLYYELKAAERNVHEITARYMASKKPEADVKLNKAKDFADAFAALLKTVIEMPTVKQVDEAISKNKEKAGESVKEGEEEYVLGKHSGTYYRLIGQASKLQDPAGFINDQINKLIDLTNNKVTKVLPGLTESLQKDIADLEAYAKDLQQKESNETPSKNKEKAADKVKWDEDKLDLSRYSTGYYMIICQSKKECNPINFIQEKIEALKELRKSLNVSTSGFRLCTKDINDLQDYLKELMPQVADPVI